MTSPTLKNSFSKPKGKMKNKKKLKNEEKGRKMN